MAAATAESWSMVEPDLVSSFFSCGQATVVLSSGGVVQRVVAMHFGSVVTSSLVVVPQVRSALHLSAASVASVLHAASASSWAAAIPKKRANFI